MTAATGLPAASIIGASSGTLPDFASASAIIPGMMKMNTGSSLRHEPKIVPRRASVSFGAMNVRCTMCWSVHQYHRPTIGAQNNIPSHG